MPGSSSRIFLSYRREDAAPYARLLQIQLRERFPDARVFMDLDSIEAGLDFAEVIREAVDSCAVLVALIGRQWVTLTDEEGHRRLDNPDDYVRFEIQTALERGVRVIPVLVDGTKPVRQQQLPSGLQKLARLSALELSVSRYQYDADRLLDLIQSVLAPVRHLAAADRQAVEQAERQAREQAASAPSRYTYFPDTAAVPEWQAVNIRNRSYVVGALVDIPAPGAQGVLFAYGSRIGGHALYVKDNRLHYVHNFDGTFEQKIDGREDIPVGENVILSASFDKDGEAAPSVATGILSLYHVDNKVGDGRIKTQPEMFFSNAGDGLCVGRDSGDPVTDDYPGDPPYNFTAGTIKRVAVDIADI